MDTKNEASTPSPAKRCAVHKKNFEDEMELLIWLYRQYPEELRGIGVKPETLEADLDAYRAVRATEEGAKRNLAMLRAMRRMRGGKLRAQATGLYERALSVSRTDERMERFLDGLRATEANPVERGAVLEPDEVQH